MTHRHRTSAWRGLLGAAPLRLATCLPLLLCSCDSWWLDDKFEGGDYFYLENDQAIMPIWVRGNTSADTFLLFLHGGPGNTSFDYATSPAYQQLGREYRMVYWDQRGSGASQGNAEPKSLSLPQYVEDTRKVIELLYARYSIQSLFLIGKSWGGALGTAYLIEEQLRDTVTGWIEVDGAHNLEDGNVASWNWVIAHAQEKIDQGERIGHWRREIEWYRSQPESIDIDYFLRHGRNLNDLHGVYRDPTADPGNALPWASPVPVLCQLNAYFLNRNNHLNLRRLNFSARMAQITIPSLVLWGRHDGVLPVALAQDAYDHLGTPAEDKHLVIFESSAHVPSREQPHEFVAAVRLFVERYR